MRGLNEIDEAKKELYTALEANKSLVSSEVCLISSRLDKLIIEYQLEYVNGRA